MSYIRPYLPDVSFITLHYLYFIVTTLVTSLIFWGSSTPFRSVSYVDSLFLTVSAMSEAGLNTINLSTLNTFQQILLFILIMMGSAIFVSSAIIHIRKRAFERRLEDLAERKRKLRPGRALTFSFSKRRASSNIRDDAVASGAMRGQVIKLPDAPTSPVERGERKGHINGNVVAHQSSPTAMPQDGIVATSDGVNYGSSHFDDDQDKFDLRSENPPDHIHFGDGQHEHSNPRLHHHRPRSKLFTGSGVGVRNLDNHPKNAQPVSASKFEPIERQDHDTENVDLQKRAGSFAAVDKYLKTINGYVGRNSQFHNLSEKERRKLGGIEYDAIELLSYIVPIYFVLWQLLGALGVGAWIQINRPGLGLENGRYNLSVSARK